MNRWYIPVIVILLGITAISIEVGIINSSYGRTQLRAFNRLNGTHYTLDQWRIYEYEIKQAYPFKEPSDE